MANAGGRLVGTLISGFLYEATAEAYGLAALLWISSGFFVAAAAVSCFLVGNGSSSSGSATAQESGAPNGADKGVVVLAVS